MHQAIELYDEYIQKCRDSLTNCADSTGSCIIPDEVSPLVAWAAVAKVVVALYKMKSSADSDSAIQDALQEIGQKLKAINARLSGIENQLNDITTRLDKLGVAIDRVPAEIVLLRQRGLVRNISLRAPHWSANSENHDVINEVRNALGDLCV